MQSRYCNLSMPILALILCLPQPSSTAQESAEKKAELEALIMKKIEEKRRELATKKKEQQEAKKQEPESQQESELVAEIRRRIEEKKTEDQARVACEKLAAELLKIYDANKNRRIDKTEFRKIWRSPDAADMNGDGYIGELELNKWLLQRLLPPNYEGYAERLLKNYDQDKDGRLSKEELKSFVFFKNHKMHRLPQNADKNLDGYVDKNELIDCVTNMRGVSPDNAASGFLDSNGHLVHELTLRDAQVAGPTEASGYLWTIKKDGSWTRQPFSEYGKLNEADQKGRLSKMQLSILAETLARCDVNGLPLRIDQYHGANPHDFTLTFQKTWSALRVKTNAPLPTAEENQAKLGPADRFSTIARLMLSQMSESE